MSPAGPRELLAEERYEEVLALAGEAAEGDALLARGAALSGLGRFEEAIAVFSAATGSGRITLEALTRLATAMAALGRGADALSVLDGAVALQPDVAGVRFQRGLLKLQLGDFAGGWADYEARWAAERFVAESRGMVPQALVPELATELSARDLVGERVLLLGEQGIGDQVMFASMIPDLAGVAASIFCVCEPRLVRLFSASFPGVRFSSPKDAVVDTDLLDRMVAMGSLGYAFRRRVEDFPGTPYLTPSSDARDRWAERLGPGKRLRVGLSWRGGAATTRRRARSLTLEQLAPVLALPCDFVSLQYGATEEELAAAPQLRAFPAGELEDFDHLAGLVANLDLVVSVQTSLVHLAGAIGAQCLTLVPSQAEWRYMARGPAMPWYDSVRLFRQPRPGEWGLVVDAAAAEVRRRL